MKGLMKFFSQPADMGALPTIYARASRETKTQARDRHLWRYECEPRSATGEYIGPDGRGNRKGYPAIEIPAPGVFNAETMNRLWTVSEELTGVSFDF